jgi:hypothetical protein
MKKRSTRQCELGIPKRALTEAIREWDAADDRKQWNLVVGSSGSYVASLPRYPTPGTPEYTRCIQSWFSAMQKAQMLDQTVQQMTAIKSQIEMLTTQLGVLQGQINSGEAILTALTGAYQGCMTGTPV